MKAGSVMKKVKKLIVGIDLGSKSNHVLKRALMIAKQNKAKLFIMHVIEAPWFSLPSYFGAADDTIDTKALQKKIDKKIQRLNTEYQVSYAVLIEEGKVSDALLYKAALIKADMLIIGANKSKKKNYLATSTEKIVHQSSLPVLVVRKSARKAYENIIAATDFLTESKQGIAFAQTVFPKAAVSAVHGVEIFYMDDSYALVGRDLSGYNEMEKKNAQENMKNLLKKFSLKKGKVLENGYDTKQIVLDYINKGSYDLTVVGSRGLGGAGMFLGSVSTFILRKASTDVLVYVS